jgi:hypothetical protein
MALRAGGTGSLDAVREQLLGYAQLVARDPHIAGTGQRLRNVNDRPGPTLIGTADFGVLRDFLHRADLRLPSGRPHNEVVPGMETTPDTPHR